MAFIVNSYCVNSLPVRQIKGPVMKHNIAADKSFATDCFQRVLISWGFVAGRQNMQSVLWSKAWKEESYQHFICFFKTENDQIPSMYSYFFITIPIITCLEVFGFLLFRGYFQAISLNGCPDHFTRSCYVSDERLSLQLRSSNILQNNSYKIRKRKLRHMTVYWRRG